MPVYSKETKFEEPAVLLTETASQIRLYRSKLDSTIRHLEAILKKKARLELEIKSLKKTIQSRKTKTEKNLKLALQVENVNLKDSSFLLESDESLLSEDRKVLEKEVYELRRTFREAQLLLEEYATLEI